MKTLFIVLLSTLITTHSRGQDVSDILNQISLEKETKKSSNVNSPAIQPIKEKEPPAKREQPKPKKEARKPEGRKTPEQTKKQPAAPQVPGIRVYRAKDKLPKDLAGCGVAGDFLVTGEDPLGGASVISAQDATNPFAREFIIKNVSSGYSPGTVLPLQSRRLITISPQRPLIFIGRDILPGQYQVRAQ